MAATTVLERGGIAAVDYRCSATPSDRPFVEVHPAFSINYVRKGSFGYRSGGRSFELVAGSVLVGRPGDEYVCTHDHVQGDVCVSFRLAPALVEAIGGKSAIWRSAALPPLPELMVFGSCACASIQSAASTARRRSSARAPETDGAGVRPDARSTNRAASSIPISSRPVSLDPAMAACASSPNTISSGRGGSAADRQIALLPPITSTSAGASLKDTHTSPWTWSCVHTYSSPGRPTRTDPATSSNDRPPER